MPTRLGWGGVRGAEASTDCGRQINRKDKKLKVKNPEEEKKKKALPVTMKQIKRETHSLLLVIGEAGGSFTSSDGR